MATDTELTFVRCPSCRSLVPAVSTRCRMCGASLEASGTEEEDESQAKSGRVRQRTMSKPKSDLNSAVQQLRAEADDESASADPFGENGSVDSVEASGGAVAEGSADEGGDLADPLGAYLDDVEEETPEEPAPFAPVEPEPSPFAPPSEPEPSPFAPPSEPEPVQLAPDPEPVIEPEPIVEPEPEPEPEPEVVVKPEIVPDPVQEEPEPFHAAPESEEVSRPESSKPEEKPKLVIESGSKKSKRGLSFGSSKASEEKKMSPVDEEKVEEEVEEVAPARRKRSRNRKRNRKKEVVEEVEEIVEAAPEYDDDDDDDDEPAPQPSNKRRRPSSDAPRAHITANRSGRLFGWLVSYSHSDGDATELREGKFFVTNSSLKNTDLVIDEPSVSTPHAMVRISVRDGFVCQDLMSERGVFVRRRDDDTYQKIDDTVTVEHGDWLRFGDVEFLISLIAHVGVK